MSTAIALGLGIGLTGGGAGEWSVGIRPGDTLGVEDVLAADSHGVVTPAVDLTDVPVDDRFVVVFGIRIDNSSATVNGVWSDGTASTNGCQVDITNTELDIAATTFSLTPAFPGGLTGNERLDVSLMCERTAINTISTTVKVNGVDCGTSNVNRAAFNIVNLKRYSVNDNVDGTMYYFQMERGDTGATWRLFMDDGPGTTTLQPEAGGLTNTLVMAGAENTNWQWADKPGVTTAPAITPITAELVGANYTMSDGDYTFGGTAQTKTWYRNVSTSIGTGNTYTVQEADAEQSLDGTVEVTNKHGVITVRTSNQVTPAALAVPSYDNDSSMTAVDDGDQKVGNTVDLGTYGNWDAGNPPTITASTYDVIQDGQVKSTDGAHTITVADAQNGNPFQIRAVRSNATGASAPATDGSVQPDALASPTRSTDPGDPTIVGTVELGQTVNTDGGTWTYGNPTTGANAIQWERQPGGSGPWQDVTGETGTSITLTDGSPWVAGDKVRYRDTATPTGWSAGAVTKTATEQEVQQGGAVAWDPDQLFQGAEEGSWSAIAAASLGENSTGPTGDVVDGDPVGLLEDQSPNGNNFLQATAAQRPIYRQAWGLEWLEARTSEKSMTTLTGWPTAYNFALGVSWRAADVHSGEYGALVAHSDTVDQYAHIVTTTGGFDATVSVSNGGSNQNPGNRSFDPAQGAHDVLAQVFPTWLEISSSYTTLAGTGHAVSMPTFTQTRLFSYKDTQYAFGNIYGFCNRNEPSLDTTPGGERDELRTWMLDQALPKPDPDTFTPADATGVTLKVWLDPTDLTTMWQERDGSRTTQITADGQPVGEIVSKDASSVSFRAPSDVARPTFRDDGVRRWLEFDGTDDYLASSGNVSIGSDADYTFTFCLGVQLNDLTVGMIMEHSELTDTFGGFYLNLNGVGNSYTRVNIGSTGNVRAAEFDSIGLDSINVFTFQNYDLTFAGRDVLRSNDINIKTADSQSGSPSGVDLPLYVGARGDSGGSLFADMNLYQLVVYDGDMEHQTGSPPDRENVQRFVANKTKALPE